MRTQIAIRVSNSDAARLGLPVPKTGKRANKPTVIADASWQAHGLPVPKREHRFCERLWKIDFAFVEEKLAVEIEGGIWIKGGGRHNRGKSMQKEMAKYNRLSILGWHLIRGTPQDVKSGAIFETIRVFLSRRRDRFRPLENRRTGRSECDACGAEFYGGTQD